MTLRALRGVPNLRVGGTWVAVERALRAGAVRPGFRLVHFSVQSNHLHLLVEAAGAEALARGLQGLAIRLARAVNRAGGRTGKVWGGRYHARALRSPAEVRHALCHVLQNARRHAGLEGGMVDPAGLDPRSSAAWFDGWRRDEAPALAADGGPGGERDRLRAGERESGRVGERNGALRAPDGDRGIGQTSREAKGSERADGHRADVPTRPARGPGSPGAPPLGGAPPLTRPPRTWLLSRGWRRHGLIRVDEVPRAAPR